MARPLRIEYEGAWYHVMNRGANRRSIFLTETDNINMGVIMFKIRWTKWPIEKSKEKKK